MPRISPTSVTPVTQMGGPRLWNAKRRIETSKALHPEYLRDLERDPYSEQWRLHVSEDVVKFVDDYEGRDKTGQPIREMLPEEKLQLLKSPARYFSRPHRVPPSLRKQIYFPDFTVTLLRTPHLGPQFAAFDVPLWFGKLDIKSYLQNLYNVEVSHVRSFVIYQKVDRHRPTSKYQRGRNFQPTYKKKMTAQLVEPFVYPAELSKKELNTNDYEKDKYWTTSIKYYESNRAEQEDFLSKPNMKHRRSIADQARALLLGKQKWQPTWKQLSTDVRAMEGSSGVQRLSDYSPSSRSSSSKPQPLLR